MKEADKITELVEAARELVFILGGRTYTEGDRMARVERVRKALSALDGNESKVKQTTGKWWW